MGKHFDTLVEIVRNHLEEDEEAAGVENIKTYLSRIIAEAALFEFPFGAEEIRPRLSKDNAEYGDYLRDYFQMSGRYGHFVLTPFPTTAIEDKTSVVILRNVRDNEFIVIICNQDMLPSSCGNIEWWSLVCAYIKLGGYDLELHLPVQIVGDIYEVNVQNRERVASLLETSGYGATQAITRDLVQATTSYLEQVIYIMDPANFILRKENNQSIRERERLTKKGNKSQRLYKTIMRPHYICLSEADTSQFLTNSSKEPRPAHPVRGHWRTLQSEVYTRMRGQRIFIQQYFTGQGRVAGTQGWNYQVMVKDSPNTIVPYEEKAS